MGKPSHAIESPSLSLLALEPRAFLELGAYLLSAPLLNFIPEGDGHPVLVLPGFATADWYTIPMRQLLSKRGYQCYGWQLGLNLGYSRELDARMRARLEDIYHKHGAKVSLIGYSLGGIYARELARWRPQMVRLVVTLGSPFSAEGFKLTNLSRLYELFSGKRFDDMDAKLTRHLNKPPPVPSTAIFSKTDGIAPSECCVEPQAPFTENIQVPGSHCGLMHNPLALWTVADRLAQPAENWQPFERSSWLKSLLYPEPCEAEEASLSAAPSRN